MPDAPHATPGESVSDAAKFDMYALTGVAVATMELMDDQYGRRPDAAHARGVHPPEVATAFRTRGGVDPLPAMEQAHTILAAGAADDAGGRRAQVVPTKQYSPVFTSAGQDEAHGWDRNDTAGTDAGNASGCVGVKHAPTGGEEGGAAATAGATALQPPVLQYDSEAREEGGDRAGGSADGLATQAATDTSPAGAATSVEEVDDVAAIMASRPAMEPELATPRHTHRSAPHADGARPYVSTRVEFTTLHGHRPAAAAAVVHVSAAVAQRALVGAESDEKPD